MSTGSMSDKKKKIIEMIQKMSGEYSVYQIFDDWVSMFAIAVANQVVFDQDREDVYIQLSQKHKDKIEKFFELNGLLVDAMEEGMEDILGYIYMHLELGSSRTGQFFTP